MEICVTPAVQPMEPMATDGSGAPPLCLAQNSSRDAFRGRGGFVPRHGRKHGSRGPRRPRPWPLCRGRGRRGRDGPGAGADRRPSEELDSPQQCRRQLLDEVVEPLLASGVSLGALALALRFVGHLQPQVRRASALLLEEVGVVEVLGDERRQGGADEIAGLTSAGRGACIVGRSCQTPLHSLHCCSMSLHRGGRGCLAAGRT